jgi:hypothetical protein
MANGFRVVSIHLDKNEVASGLTAATDGDAIDYMRRTLGEIAVHIRKIGDPPVTNLSLAQVRQLEKACVDARDAGLDTQTTRDIHASLDRVAAMTIKF